MKKIYRPEFPKKAIVTAGMPYGNKELHFGHVGGLFVHADTYARFLRDRIGTENVVFVSGTDCYGSPIIANYRKKVEEEGYEGSIEDYVMANHENQKATLDSYEMGLNLFATSAFGDAGEMHKKVSKEVFDCLHDGGYLEKLSTPQFYDEEHDTLLNGRQVVGKCPIDGCQSDKAYADECAMGHQYMPNELINPISTLSGKKPVLKEVTNWYFKLHEYTEQLQGFVKDQQRNTTTRKYVLKTIEEFLKPPVIYVQRKLIEDLDALVADMPEHELINEEKKPSFTFVFNNLEARDKARDILTEKGIFFRTGKTLVPFRLSGNIDWGVPVPNMDGLDDLTFWVWPESLWAPVSFTKTYLESIGADKDEWKNYWLNEEAKVYQFIGEDNIYFYGIAEMGMAMALRGVGAKDEEVDFRQLNLPQIVANNHVLFMNKKASSSSEVKPPMAAELLNHYTSDQLRMHFLSLGLAKKSVSFMPQVYMTEEEKEGPDTVLKDGNLLTNVFNRTLRTYFYTAQKYFDSKIPQGEPCEKIVKLCEDNIIKYERHMYKQEFHSVIYVLDDIIRKLNKHFVNNMRTADKNEDNELRAQILVDTMHGIKTVLAFLHPITPSSVEGVREYLNFNEKIWDWNVIFEGIDVCIDDREAHALKFLEPRVDFFAKHESQLIFDEE